MNNKESAIKLFKNIVKSTKNTRAIINALEGAYEISPDESIEWFKEVSSNPDYKNNYYVRDTFFKLLPEIVNDDKKTASDIFYNLLDPELIEDEYASLLEKSPKKRARVDTMAIYGAKLVIVELFEKAPKEFAKVTFDLILKYRDIPRNSKSDEILDVASIVWYHNNPTYEEVDLLKKIEEISIDWSENNDVRVDEVIQVFEKESYSLAKFILISIFLGNPKKYFEKLYEASINILITVDDIQHFLSLCLSKILPNCKNVQIEKINSVMLTHPIYQDEKGEDIQERKFLLSSIPKEFQNESVKKWLETDGKDIKPMKTRGEHGPPQVFSSFEESEKEEEEKFDELSEKNQEKVIQKIIESWKNKVGKSEKIEILENIESFLQKDKGKLEDALLVQLEPIIQTFLSDPDPKEEFESKDEIGSASLLTFPTVRATAASCQFRITYHRSTPENIELCDKISQDYISLVREDAARNLRYLAFADFETSFKIAKRFQSDNHRVLFYLTDYIRFITGNHPDESYYFCEYFLNTRGKEKSLDSSDFIIDMVTSITIHMTLKQNNKKFSELFERILRDDSYNYVVKQIIAFRCKDEALLYDESLQNEILEIYNVLFDSQDPHVRNDADFFLLNVITKDKKSFLPEIKPILEKVSNMKYDASSDDFLRLNILDYVEEFWQEIPEDSVRYLITLYEKNPKLVTNFHKSRDIIKTMEDMFKSKLIKRESKKELISILMLFAKAGWPEANQVLKVAENNI